MSWFISLMLAGAVFTSGNNLPNYEYQNTATNDLNSARNTVLDETEPLRKLIRLIQMERLKFQI